MLLPLRTLLGALARKPRPLTGETVSVIQSRTKQAQRKRRKLTRAELLLLVG